MKEMHTLKHEHQGSLEEFESEWEEALKTDRIRHLAYPNAHPSNQVELFEREKARQIDAVLKAKGIQNGLVLEYGCGSAGMSIYLHNLGFTAVASDVSLNALKVADKNYSRNGSGESAGLNLLAANAFQLPFADHTFDIVMSYGLLEHFDDEQAFEVIKESVRILKPGGIMLSDIIHSRFSARTVGLALSFSASFLYHVISLDFKRLRGLRSAYFHEFYENDLNDKDWYMLLQRAGLRDVDVRVCRPFPPLALGGYPEKLYVGLMERCLRFWHWFDASQSWLIRRWGWMYLTVATKPERQSLSDAEFIQG